MQKIIVLMWKDISIAKLAYENEKYWYMIIKENLEKASSEGCPTILFKNKEGKRVLNNIPPIFDNYIIDNAREDLIEKCGINPDDDIFTKLCKATKLDIGKDEFWIKLEER